MKRYLAAALWAYSFWYLGSVIAAILGVPDLIGPVLGPAAGIIVGFDPRGVIWGRAAATAPTTATASSATAPNAA